jgi:hypothetical protein
MYFEFNPAFPNKNANKAIHNTGSKGFFAYGVSSKNKYYQDKKREMKRDQIMCAFRTKIGKESSTSYGGIRSSDKVNVIESLLKSKTNATVIADELFQDPQLEIHSYNDPVHAPQRPFTANNRRYSKRSNAWMIQKFHKNQTYSQRSSSRVQTKPIGIFGEFQSKIPCNSSLKGTLLKQRKSETPIHKPVSINNKYKSIRSRFLSMKSKTPQDQILCPDFKIENMMSHVEPGEIE